MTHEQIAVEINELLRDITNEIACLPPDPLTEVTSEMLAKVNGMTLRQAYNQLEKLAEKGKLKWRWATSGSSHRIKAYSRK